MNGSITTSPKSAEKSKGLSASLSAGNSSRPRIAGRYGGETFWREGGKSQGLEDGVPKWRTRSFLTADPQALITVWGTYRVPVDEIELPASPRRYYFFGNAGRDVGSGVHTLIETCIPLALFEVTLENLDERFRISHFTQEMPEAPRKHWQVPYDEALLSSDGMQLLAGNSKCTRGLHGGRIAFYFHYYDPTKPMLWAYEQFCCHPVQTVPRRLWDLIPYTPVD